MSEAYCETSGIYKDVQNLNRGAVVRAGTVFKCETGHILARAREDIATGASGWEEKIEWLSPETPEPKAGDLMPLCAKCGFRLVLWINEGHINGFPMIPTVIADRI